MRPVIRTSAAITIIAFTALGCSNGTAGGAGTTTRTTPSEQVTSDPARPASELVRVTGTVVTGSREGCLVLDTGFSRYVLVGGDQAALTQSAENEEELTVTGQAYTPEPAPCTDGIPLAVEQAVPAT